MHEKSNTSDVFVVCDFLAPAEAKALAAKLRESSGAAAAVYGNASGGAVTPSVRSVLRLDVQPDLLGAISARLESVKPQLERHFALHLGPFDEPQCLRYRAGDFFVAHQDGNVPLLYDDSRFRRVSVVLFLNSQGAAEGFGGGSLVMHGHYAAPHEPQDVTAPAGTLVAFRSEETHEVTPVTDGERLTIVTWFRASLS